jgi:signal transduction histidine kinase
VNLYGQNPVDVSRLTIEQCLKLAEEKKQTGDIRESTNFLNMAAEKYWDAKDYENAVKYYNQSIELNKLISNYNGIAGINSNLGLIHFDMGKYEASYEYFRKTYQYRKEHNEKVPTISALINASVVLNKMERYDESVQVLEEAATMSREINDYAQMRSCYGMLSEAYTKAGNTEKAADYFQLYKTVHDALIKESEDRYSEANVRAQLAEKEKELAEKEKELAERENQYINSILSEKEKALEGMDSTNRQLLESKTNAELIIENLKVKDEISDLQKNEMKIQLENEQIKSQLLVVVLCVSLVIVLVIGYFLWEKKRTNRKLEQKNLLINQQKHELEAAFVEIKEKNEELLTYIQELAAVNEQLNRTQKALDDYQAQLEQLVIARTTKLRQALEKAQESDRFKAAFFANMSHEIRTPLSAILGLIQFIDDPLIGFEERKEMYDIINYNATQLLKMVDDIVTLSRIDSGLITIQPKETDIDSMLQDIQAETEKMIMFAKKKNLEIIIENRLPDDMKSLFIDGKRIFRVLMLLVDNSVKYTDRGYVQVGIDVDQDERKLSFWVEDTGIGIERNYLGLIFKRFWKKGDSYTQEYRGLGIGLALCKELLDLMGGTIFVESTIDKGSTFSFTINY